MKAKHKQKGVWLVYSTNQEREFNRHGHSLAPAARY